MENEAIIPKHKWFGDWGTVLGSLPSYQYGGIAWSKQVASSWQDPASFDLKGKL